jgi:hypothetical protein
MGYGKVAPAALSNIVPAGWAATAIARTNRIDTTSEVFFMVAVLSLGAYFLSELLQPRYIPNNSK